MTPEHTQIAQLARELSQAKIDLIDGTHLARTVLHLVEPGDNDQATALRALRGWVERQLAKGD